MKLSEFNLSALYSICRFLFGSHLNLPHYSDNLPTFCHINLLYLSLDTVNKPGNNFTSHQWVNTDCYAQNHTLCCDMVYHHYTPRTTKLLGGILVSLRPSVRPSVRLSRLPCPLCNIYSSGWILSILATNDHYHERMCPTQWPLTLTYIFKVIRPWLRKSCPLCSVYSSGWILFIFGTNDHYH